MNFNIEEYKQQTQESVKELETILSGKEYPKNQIQKQKAEILFHLKNEIEKANGFIEITKKYMSEMEVTYNKYLQ
jgi:hypothetical protein